MATNQNNVPVGSQMSYWIAATLRDERERRKINRADAARALRVAERSLRRFERYEHRAQDVDQLVAGYAYLFGLEDGRELWSEALSRWQEHGSPPQFAAPPSPATAFADAIRAEALRNPPDADEMSRRHDAKRKKRGAG